MGKSREKTDGNKENFSSIYYNYDFFLKRKNLHKYNIVLLQLLITWLYSIVHETSLQTWYFTNMIFYKHAYAYILYM